MEDDKKSQGTEAVSMRKKYPKEKYPREVASFRSMQARVAEGKSTASWPRTTEGFFAFLKCMGRVPKEMKDPTIGRKNHSKGYGPGNCKWQERSDNSKESCLRRWKKETNFDFLIAANLKRWSKPGARKRHSVKMKKIKDELFASGYKYDEMARKNMSAAQIRYHQNKRLSA